MDSRGPQSGPPHQTHHHQPPQQPPRMMMHQHHHHHHHTAPYPQHQHHQHGPTNPNPTMITQNSPPLLQNNTNHNNNSRFPFNNNSSQTTPSNPSIDQLSSGGYSGDGLRDPHGSGSGSGPAGFGFDPHKKKRGRPRKYSPDGGGGGGGGSSSIALGLAPTPISPPLGGGGPGGGARNNGGDGGGGGGQGDSSGTTHSSEHKKHRGRPPSSSKKQLDALGNCGVGFTPHVILVNAGEDIASKIMAFSKEGPRTVCILSANGSICNVSLRQPTMSGIVNYEGRFDIISLSGSFLFLENNGGQVRTGGLSVSLAGTDGRVLGGGVAGVLVAASPVQIIVGSFIADGKKPKYMPSVPNSHMLSFSAPAMAPAVSPVSQEASSEGSEENGSNHINRNMGSYGNSNHPIHNMQMYTPMGWPNSG